jgi:hypothetical protein
MKVPVDIICRYGIKRGTILHSTLFESIDHGKFFVVVGVTEEAIAGYFFVNSNINRYISKKSEMMDMQFIIKRSDYAFLRYDSFLSAVKINEISCTRLAESIADGETEIVGMLKEADMSNLLEHARKSRLFSKKEKEMYLYE